MRDYRLKGLGLGLGLALLVLLAVPVATAERLALVIGNGGYTGLEALANPRNDATAMAQALKGLGYRLVGRDGKPADGPLVDLDQEGLLEAMDAFAQAASGQEIAFLYYAGHGFQDGVSSYLVPVDAPKPKKTLEILKGRSVPLDQVIRRLDGKAQMVVAVFDACREIPELEAMAGQSRGGGLSGEGNHYRGLLRVKGTSTSGRLIAYAGAAGQLVKDGAGDHSPYTQLLLDRLGSAAIEKKNIELTIFFQQVAWDFREHQEGQDPLLEISAKPGTFYLLPGPVGDRELAFWNSVKDSRNPAVFRIYLKRFPGGEFADPARARLAKLEGIDPPPPPGPRADLDLEFWKNIKDSGNPADFRAYLDQYPAGAFAKLAQNRLAELEEAARRELAFWNSIKDSRNPADFRAYLDQYPAGAFAKLAQNRLAELDKAAREAEDQRRQAEEERRRQAEEDQRRQAEEERRRQAEEDQRRKREAAERAAISIVRRYFEYASNHQIDDAINCLKEPTEKTRPRLENVEWFRMEEVRLESITADEAQVWVALQGKARDSKPERYKGTIPLYWNGSDWRIVTLSNLVKQ
jgi:hypothetical protein